MVHLIGVSHDVQIASVGISDCSKHVDYAQQIIAAVNATSASVLAEECSDWALAETAKKRRVSSCVSVTKTLADKLNVDHLFCDPNGQERRGICYREALDIEINKQRDWSEAYVPQTDVHHLAYGIEIKYFWPRREAFWLSCICNRLDDNVIFVCGNDHINTFPDLLTERGVQFEVLQTGIGVNADSPDEYTPAVKSLDRHPNLVQRFLADCANSSYIPS